MLVNGQWCRDRPAVQSDDADGCFLRLSAGFRDRIGAGSDLDRVTGATYLHDSVAAQRSV